MFAHPRLSNKDFIECDPGLISSSKAQLETYFFSKINAKSPALFQTLQNCLIRVNVEPNLIEKIDVMIKYKKKIAATHQIKPENSN